MLNQTQKNAFSRLFCQASIRPVSAPMDADYVGIKTRPIGAVGGLLGMVARISNAIENGDNIGSFDDMGDALERIASHEKAVQYVQGVEKAKQQAIDTPALINRNQAYYERCNFPAFQPMEQATEQATAITYLANGGDITRPAYLRICSRMRTKEQPRYARPDVLDAQDWAWLDSIDDTDTGLIIRTTLD